MQPDRVDEIVGQWHRERPDLDVSGMEIIGRISRIERLLRQRLDTTFDRHGLESWEFDVLATLRRSGAPYRLTPGDLLDSMMITSGAMTNRIDRLQARSFVERTRHPDDGRQVLVALTAAGLDTIEAAVADHTDNELQIVGSLGSRQQAQLVDLLRTLHLALAAHDD